MKRVFVIFGFSMGVILFLVFVYPTPYEYTRKAPNIWRVNRFSGVTEIATDSGWRTEKEVEGLERARMKTLTEEAEMACGRLTFNEDDATPYLIEGSNETAWSFSIDKTEVTLYWQSTANEPMARETETSGTIGTRHFEIKPYIPNRSLLRVAYNGIDGTQPIILKVVITVYAAQRGEDTVFFDEPLVREFTRNMKEAPAD